MQRLLPAGIEAIGNRPFLVCGVLDNYEGDYSRLTICLLIRGSDDDAVDIDGPPTKSNDFLARSSAFGIDVKGGIVSYLGDHEAAAFRLAPWLVPADYRGPLTLTERASGKRHTFELKSEEIIRTPAQE
jgi:hypothetical protein